MKANKINSAYLKRERERKKSSVNLCKINIMSPIIHSIECIILVKILSAVFFPCVFICLHRVRESIHLLDVLLFHHQSILVGD